MMTAEAMATRWLLPGVTISDGASQLGGDGDTEGGSCQLSTTLSQGRAALAKWLQQSRKQSEDDKFSCETPDDDP